MVGATSKVVIFLVLSFFIAAKFSKAAWQVCKENEDVIKTIRLPIATPEPRRMVSSSANDFNVTVTQVVPKTDEVSQGPSNYDTQPPTNPYMTNPRKKESHF